MSSNIRASIRACIIVVLKPAVIVSDASNMGLVSLAVEEFSCSFHLRQTKNTLLVFFLTGKSHPASAVVIGHCCETLEQESEFF